MKPLYPILTLLLLIFPTLTTFGQEEEVFEMSPFVVTSSRELPAVTYKKKADFLILEVTIFNDSRKADQREEEIKDTVRSMIVRAERKAGITLLSGRREITEAELDLLAIVDAGKADSSRFTILVKNAVGEAADTQALIDELEKFADQTKEFGRSIVSSGNIGLSVVDPQQYRETLLSLIAADFHHLKSLFGEEFQILVHNLNRRVVWTRSSVSELELYIPYEYEVVPSKAQFLKATVKENY